MIFKELELFKDVDYEFVKEISNVCKEKSYGKDDVLFRLGAEADRLFFLVKGAVDLVIEKGSGINFGISEPGEVFGWSTMVDDGTYTATGIAISDLTVLEVERERINLIFNRHAKDGLKVMKSLAGVISKRLVGAYQDLAATRGLVSDAIE